MANGQDDEVVLTLNLQGDKASIVEPVTLNLVNDSILIVDPVEIRLNNGSTIIATLNPSPFPTDATSTTTSPPVQSGDEEANPGSLPAGTSDLPSPESSGEPTATGSPSPGLTTGQAVGVGFGSAIAAVLLILAVALIFLFIRRRKTPRRQQPLPAPPDSAALDHLEQPLAHETIRREMRSLQTGIKNYVDNYFRPEKVVIDEAGEAKIQALAGEPPKEPTWSDALGNSSLQPLIIRTIIARALFALIDPRSDRNTTLLPLDFKSAYQSLHDTGPSSRRSIDATQRIRLLSLWRRISGHLLSPHDRLDQNQVESVADELAAALAPLGAQQSDNYHSVLRGLVTSASKLGMSLFEQPHEWQAVWASSRGGAHGVILFPGLVFLVETQSSDKGHGYAAAERIRVCKLVMEE